FDTLMSYVTVYGNGQVNINTASRSVLIALGLDETVVEKILKVRRGNDGLDSTLDDHLFYRTYDIAAEVGQSVKLEPAEVRAIDQLNAKGLITTNSYFYSIQSDSFWGRSNDRKHISCVVSARESRVVYWKEK